mgnify:FL=1
MSKNRDRIIQSALSLFSEKNFEDVTIKDICQKAEVANSTFYYHFKTKEELMDCLRMHDMRPRNRELFALAATHDLMERVLVTCTMCAQRAERSGWMLTAQYYKRRLSLESESEDLKALYAQERRTAQELIGYAQAEGLISNRAEPEQLAIAAILLTNSVILNWCVARGGFDLLAQARETLMVLFCPAARNRDGKERRADETGQA